MFLEWENNSRKFQYSGKFQNNTINELKKIHWAMWWRSKVNSFYSHWEDQLLGAPQGSVLEYLLFNIYICSLFLWVGDSNRQYLTLLRLLKEFDEHSNKTQKGPFN